MKSRKEPVAPNGVAPSALRGGTLDQHGIDHGSVRGASGLPRPKRSFRLAALLKTAAALGLGMLAALSASGQALPLEIRQDGTRYNLASTNGMPISPVRGVPPGSDGRAPTNGVATPSNPSGAPGTTNQFRSLASWGGGRPSGQDQP